ncbi:DUF1697 domain-containing protein [Kaistella sp.]|uniref:DUF1697 domain-containing protein n=1 Tax=Kaistella sp. TaxID=2782235 RepID=UPI003C37CF66
MKYCAFLRGVNVKGTSMKMAEVCKVFADTGMHKISSVLATGNILFSSDLNVSELKEILEKSLSEYFNYKAFLFIKNEKEIIQIFENNPFAKSEDLHIYVFIGIENIEKTLFQEFENSDKTENEKAEIVGNTFYWQVPKGKTLDSSFGKILGKKSLKEKMTSRNLNTIEKIVKKF